MADKKRRGKKETGGDRRKQIGRGESKKIHEERGDKDKREEKKNKSGKERRKDFYKRERKELMKIGKNSKQDTGIE